MAILLILLIAILMIDACSFMFAPTNRRTQCAVYRGPRIHFQAQGSACICPPVAHSLQKRKRCQKGKRFQSNGAGGMITELIENAAEMPMEGIHGSDGVSTCAKLTYAQARAVGVGPRAFARNAPNREDT